MSETCKHGKTIGWIARPDLVWAGGSSTCVCCAQWYGWIEMSTYDEDGLESETIVDKQLCSGCGGRTTKFVRPDVEHYQHPERQKWFFVVRRFTSDELLALVRAACDADIETGTIRKLVERIPSDAPQRHEAVLLVKDKGRL